MIHGTIARHAARSRSMSMLLLWVAAMVSLACAFSPVNNVIYKRTTQQGRSHQLHAVADETNGDNGRHGANHLLITTNYESRRKFMVSLASVGLASASLTPHVVSADDFPAAVSEVQVVATGDVKKLFNEGRALEAQGNILAAQRLYIKVTKIAPNFIYGWSNLGNTLVAQGQLVEADESYSKAISLCEENLKQTDGSFGTKKCDDLYLILLNRGTVRLNTNGMQKAALADLQKSNTIRARPDAVILQNLVRDVLDEVPILSHQSFLSSN